MTIIHVVGARPNFIKVDPVMRAFAGFEGIDQKLVHTGQHYDALMSDIFFAQLGLRKPDSNLEVGSADHAEQTAAIMVRFSRYLDEQKADLVMVYGDVNSTIAAALVCAKRGIPVAHVESGLRSRDKSMPEEINRILTDRISDYLFTPSTDADENLISEGTDPARIFLVGNIMIDTLVRLLPRSEESWEDLESQYRLSSGEYGLITLHRPSNVDDRRTLQFLMEDLISCSKKMPLLFPVHPRTLKLFREFGLSPEKGDIRIIDPLGYLQFLSLQKKAALVITDSGGIQEETTYLGVPCLTLRKNTERPITITEGTNHLIGVEKGALIHQFEEILEGRGKQGRRPDLWDGRTGERIAETCMRVLQ